MELDITRSEKSHWFSDCNETWPLEFIPPIPAFAHQLLTGFSETSLGIKFLFLRILRRCFALLKKKTKKNMFQIRTFCEKCILQCTKINVMNVHHSYWHILQIWLTFSSPLSSSTAYTHALNLVSTVFSNAIKVCNHLLLDKLVDGLLVDWLTCDWHNECYKFKITSTEWVYVQRLNIRTQIVISWLTVRNLFPQSVLCDI